MVIQVGRGMFLAVGHVPHPKGAAGPHGPPKKFGTPTYGRMVGPTTTIFVIYLLIYCLQEVTMRQTYTSMWQDSEINIIVLLNTALKYKIPRNTQKTQTCN